MINYIDPSKIELITIVSEGVKGECNAHPWNHKAVLNTYKKPNPQLKILVQLNGAINSFNGEDAEFVMATHKAYMMEKTGEEK